MPGELKFSQFFDGGNLQETDVVVGLRNADGTKFSIDNIFQDLQSAYNKGNTIDLNSSDKFNINSFEQSTTRNTGVILKNGGTGYTVGDELTILGGTTAQPVRVIVSTESAGVILSVQKIEKGVYTVLPPIIDAVVTGGTGTGALFDLNFEPSNITEDGLFFKSTGGIIAGNNTLLSKYLIADFRNDNGDTRVIALPSMSTASQARLLSITPSKEFVWYNSAENRITTSLQGVVKYVSYLEDITRQLSYQNNPIINLSEAAPSVTNSFEQSAQQAFTLDNPGIGYDVGQILFTGDSSAAKILVEAVNISGEITQAKIIEEGTYTTIPSNPVNVTGGTGDGAAFNLLYQSKSVNSDSDTFKTTGGMIVGRAATLPDYAVVDLGSENVGDNRSILVSTLDTSEETRLLAKSPVNSVFWYNSDINRFRTLISGVAKTILIDDDLTLDDSTGECGFVENATETVVSGAGVYYKPAGTYIPNELAGFTHLNGVLTYTGVVTKKFRISISSTVSLNLVSGSINLAVSHNGGLLGRSRQGADLDGTSPSYVNISSNSILTLANGDTVSSVVSNLTSTDNITVKNLSVSVSSI